MDALTIIVTGAARGLGREMSLALAVAGCNVAAIDLPSATDEMDALMARAAADGTAGRIAPLVGDVTNPDDPPRIVAETLARFRGLHGLVNNAALGPQETGGLVNGRRRGFHDIDPGVWLATINANVNGPFLMAHAVVPHLLAQGWGRIVNIVTSYTTMLNQGNSPYGPTKAAMEAATVVWSRDLADTGVTVNALLPGGAANTRMIPVEYQPDRSLLNQPVVMRAPIVWLMSKQSDGVTGHRFVGKFWDPAAPVEDAVKSSGALAGWR